VSRDRLRILAFVSAYLPGFKGGGHIRTVANMAERLTDRFEFLVVTADRDFGDDAPYPGVPTGGWIEVGASRVRYLGPAERTLGRIAALLDETPHDVLYLNSAFHPAFTLRPLLARRLGRAPRRPVVIAPRGEFGRGALALKSTKKRVFLALARACRLYGGVLWQASSPAEAADVRRILGPRARVAVARDLAAIVPAAPPDGEPSKRSGALRLLYLSRIAPVKNLLAGIEAAGRLRGEIEFDVYGPVDDAAYWERCRRALDELPPNVRAGYRGPVPHDRVAAVVGRHHVFFLPSLGENFGHAIQEALVAGRPVVLSDRTPWNGVEAARAGRAVPCDPAALAGALQPFVELDQDGFSQICRRARAYGLASLRDEDSIRENVALFLSAGADPAS